MKIISSLPLLREQVRNIRKTDKRIGFVPTMGYLHNGHLSLIQKAREENDFVIISIYVNPLQFGPKEDLEKYPCDLKRDKKLVQSEGVDIIFTPEVEEVYSTNFSTFVNVEGLTEGLCGISRPDHFKGVTTIVTKLFNMVQPDRAYFGQKDAQQALVIRRLTKDLNFPIQIKILPTIREKDGLAMSSRNVYLSPKERDTAPLLYQSLLLAEKIIKNGEKDRQVVLSEIIRFLSKESRISIDYLEIVDTEVLKPLSNLKGEILIAGAILIGNIRLIDNIILEV